MAECVASENSWRLSEQFEQNCKERCKMDLIDDEFKYSLEMQSFADSCKACYLQQNEKQKNSLPNFNESQDHLNCLNYDC